MRSSETIEDVQADDYSFPQSTSALSSEPSLSEMPVSLLAERCLQEIERFRRGEPSQEQYGLELFRRATMQRDELAWESLQQCLDEILHRWIRNHPRREVLFQLDSEDNYVAQAFERFWYATACQQQVEFS